MSVSHHDTAVHHELGFLRKYIFSEDHKVIGIQFLISALLFLLVGGGLALLVRLQLGFPGANIPLVGKVFFPTTAGKMDPDTYNMLFTMHASVMIFFVIIPLLTGAFGNFLIPLTIGAPDMAFPKLNMMSYWFMWPAFAIILLSFFMPAGGAAAAGWTSYPTIASATSAAGHGVDSFFLRGSGWGQIMWLVSLIFVGISSMMGSVNYITTIINMRAPGMSFNRMPLSTWSMFITAILQAMALPVLTVALLLQLLDKTFNTCYFLPAALTGGNDATGPGSGQPLLWQHLFWFYSHPAVYIMILPAMGMVSDIIATNCRKPLFGYKPMVFSLAGIAGLGFIVWGHHMFQSGMDPRLGTGFMLATIMIALPSAVKTFNWLGTTWNANIQFNTAMLNALAFVAMFVIGGLSGIFMAATPVDIFFHDTYFIVGHIHYVLFMSSLFGIFGAIYFWFPKMFGRMMNEKWGKVHFVITFIAANCTFYPMHIVGIGGQPRRYYDPLGGQAGQGGYEFLQGLQGLNTFMTISAFVLGLAQLIFFVNFFYSLFCGPKASRNPWRSNTLEWFAPTPPPHGNFETIPVVYRGPYEYASPDCKEDYLPQTDKLEGASKVPVLH
jgi:cytochrome c oxidase subunit 1